MLVYVTSKVSIADSCGFVDGRLLGTQIQNNRGLHLVAAAIAQNFRHSYLSENKSNPEARNLLGCTAVFLIECRPTFQRYVLPPSLGP
jgi:hypothetical protein